MATDKALRDLEARVEKLESAVFARTRKGAAKIESMNFRGATGGLRFLVSKGFFGRKRAFGEITEALAGHGYHYSKQAVQTPLNTLSRPSGPLVALREGGRKLYAKRK